MDAHTACMACLLARPPACTVPLQHVALRLPPCVALPPLQSASPAATASSKWAGRAAAAPGHCAAAVQHSAGRRLCERAVCRVAATHGAAPRLRPALPAPARDSCHHTATCSRPWGTAGLMVWQVAMTSAWPRALAERPGVPLGMPVFVCAHERATDDCLAVCLTTFPCCLTDPTLDPPFVCTYKMPAACAPCRR